MTDDASQPGPTEASACQDRPAEPAPKNASPAPDAPKQENGETLTARVLRALWSVSVRFKID